MDILIKTLGQKKLLGADLALVQTARRDPATAVVEAALATGTPKLPSLAVCC